MEIGRLSIPLFVLVLALGSCTMTGTPRAIDTQVPSSGETVAPTRTPPETTLSEPPRPTAPAVLPDALIGAWEAVGGDATLAYRFHSDGRYVFAGLLTQPRDGGVFEFTKTDSGTASVAGDVLTLRATAVRSTRKDPEDPAGDYVDRPGAPTTKQYRWKVGGSELVLTEDSAGPISFKRQ